MGDYIKDDTITEVSEPFHRYKKAIIKTLT